LNSSVTPPIPTGALETVVVHIKDQWERLRGYDGIQKFKAMCTPKGLLEFSVLNTPVELSYARMLFDAVASIGKGTSDGQRKALCISASTTW